jgi:hypothetical protein
MRPLVRGPRPKNDEGKDIVFKEYAQARGSLIERIGERCSYCEMHLDSSLAVEHVKPKKPPGAPHVMTDRELDWTNFLLACTNCNSTKGDTDVVLEDYIWPDRDNSFLALNYSEGGLVGPNEGPDSVRALNTIKLVGLDKTPDTAEASDRRWENRREAWDIARDSLLDLYKNDSPEFRRQIIRTVKIGAYWSVWMTVFKDHPEMLREIIGAIPGTDGACFDAMNGYAPVSRGINL